MKTVLKYPVTSKTFTDEGDSFPAGKVLAFGDQAGQLFVWIEVDLRRPAYRRLVVLPTGAKFDNPNMVHLHTAFVGVFVWHIYGENI